MIFVGTWTFAGVAFLKGDRDRNSCSRGRSPRAISATLFLSLSCSEGFKSKVRKRSLKWKVSTTTPLLFEKALALTISMPHAESAPDRVANKDGLSIVTTVTSYRSRYGVRVI